MVPAMATTATTATKPMRSALCFGLIIISPHALLAAWVYLMLYFRTFGLVFGTLPSTFWTSLYTGAAQGFIWALFLYGNKLFHGEPLETRCPKQIQVHTREH
jgi:hypothetical protein